MSNQNKKGQVYLLASYVTELIFEVDHLFTRGGEHMRGQFSTAPGGKGFNMAVAVARANGDAKVALKIGGDPFVEMGLDFMENEGIDTSDIVKDEEDNSGIAAAVKEKGTGENLAAVDVGTNGTLELEEIPNFQEDIKQSDVFLTQLESRQSTVEEALMEAKRINPEIITILNPAPAPDEPLSEETLKAVDVLTPNKSEAIALSGVSEDKVVERAADVLIDKGVKHVIMTLGEEGVSWNSSEKKLQISPPKVEAVDALGAGDSFNGALAMALAEGMDMEEAVNFAVVASALSVTREGTCEAMPIREEIESMLE